MATTSSIQISGLQDLGRRMKALSVDMQNKVTRAATAAGAGVVRKAARAKAPRDTGNLAAALVMKRVRQSSLTQEYVVAVRKGKTRDVKAAKKGAGKLGQDAYYGGFVEFGTVKMPARPFLRPALAESVEPATEAIKKRLKARLDKVGA